MRHFKNLDWPLIILAFSLALFGLIFIFSSSQGELFNFKKQIIFLSLGIAVMAAVSFFDYRILRENPYLILAIYLFCLLALAGLFFFAPEIRGTKSWYKLGPVSFDPIEFAKIALIIILAKYFSMRHVEMYRFRHILFSGVYVLAPALLIFFQPDLGSILVLLSVWLAVLVVSGIKLRHFMVLASVFLIIVVFSWAFLLQDYQKARITSFLFPQADHLEMSWSQNQAKIAVGSGGLFGKGIGEGTQTQYKFLTESQTDFIFAAIAEETGFFGVFVLLSLFAAMVWRLIKLSLSFYSNFPRLLFVGFSALLVFQLFINVGMNLGLLPVIGIPLPFVSYGGSGLVALFLGLGILQSVKAHSYFAPSPELSQLK